jgi:hypothetical protein
MLLEYRVMASRASKSRWFLRDLPRSYIVLGVAVAGAGIVAISIDWSSPPPSAATAVAQPTKAELEKRYRGSIIFPTNRDGICLTVLLDNRTGHLTEGGYGKCESDEPRKVAEEPDKQARLRALGSAFRR